MAFSEPAVVCDWSGGHSPSIREVILKYRQDYLA